MRVTCTQCHTYMGETDDVRRSKDLCRTCFTKWIAIEKQKVNLMARTMDATYSAMSKEARHAEQR